MTDYTPTTEEVRTRYWLNDGEPSDPSEGEEFDRWLEGVREGAREAGYNEGWDARDYVASLNGSEDW